MLPIQQLAAEIDKLQPDLKEFWKLSASIEQTITDLIQEPYSALNAFKLELLMCYAITNPKVYVGHTLREVYIEYANRYNLPIYTQYIKLITRSYSNLQVFKLKVKHVEQQYLIINNVANPRKYMNAYLKSVGATSVSSAINKNLEPNEMSLVVFTNWLDSTKPLNSVQALAFLEQIRSFGDHNPELQSKFLDTILTHCPKPSIELQKKVTDSFARYDKKYFSLTRWSIRREIDKYAILAFPSIHSEQDSTFKPFVANLTTTPVTTSAELSSLLSTAMMLLQRTNPLTEAEHGYLTSLLTYINNPGHSELLTLLKDSLRSTQRTITSLLDQL